MTGFHGKAGQQRAFSGGVLLFEGGEGSF